MLDLWGLPSLKLTWHSPWKPMLGRPFIPFVSGLFPGGEVLGQPPWDNWKVKGRPVGPGFLACSQGVSKWQLAPLFMKKSSWFLEEPAPLRSWDQFFKKKRMERFQKWQQYLDSSKVGKLAPQKWWMLVSTSVFGASKPRTSIFCLLRSVFFLGNSYAPPLVQAPVRWRNVLVLSRSRCVACSMVGRMAGDVFFLLPCDFKTFGMGELFASSSMLFSRDKESKVCSLGSTTKKCHSDWETRVRTLTQKISIWNQLSF